MRNYEIAGVITFMSHARDALLEGHDVSGHRGQILRAVVGHAVHFYTWRSLVKDQGLSKTDAVQLMCEMIIHAAE